MLHFLMGFLSSSIQITTFPTMYNCNNWFQRPSNAGNNQLTLSCLFIFLHITEGNHEGLQIHQSYLQSFPPTFGMNIKSILILQSAVPHKFSRAILLAAFPSDEISKNAQLYPVICNCYGIERELMVMEILLTYKMRLQWMYAILNSFESLWSMQIIQHK